MPSSVLTPSSEQLKPASRSEGKPVKSEFDLYSWIVQPMRFRPFFFAVGVFFGFAACTVAGHVVANQAIYKNFERFHNYINPTTLFYPTVSQMVAMAEANSKPDQTIVIVGGNSIFYGLGQNQDKLWSLQLKKLLGDRFSVFNFALPQAYPFESAYFAAEALMKKHRKVLYLTVTLPGMTRSPEGSEVYGYTYWDAHEKHLLCHDAERDRVVAEHIKTEPEKEKERLAELQLRAKLDSLFYFEDLWTAMGYNNLFTCWTKDTASHPFKSRKEYESEKFVPEPLSTRFHHEIDLASTRRYCRGYFEDNTATPKPWRWARIDKEMNEAVPFPFKRNCIVFVATHAPALLAQMTDVENERERLSSKLSVEHWTQAGFASHSFRGELVTEDFLDSRHLLPSGGAKIAPIVAREVVALNDRLHHSPAP